MKNILIYTLVAFAFIGCTSQKNYVLFNQAHISTPDANKTVTKLNTKRYEYRILPHDRISITMYNHPELGTSTIQSQREDTRGILVNSVGNVRLPLIKNIHIAGLTQVQAEKKIEHAFKRFLEDCEVSIEVLNKRAYVLGEVKKPGTVALFNEKMTLLQLLATAGDFTDEANRKAIVIMKNRNNIIHTQTIDLTGVNSLILANTMIYPNDVVYVAPNGMKVFNVGVKESTPTFDLAGKILNPIASVKYLTD